MKTGWASAPEPLEVSPHQARSARIRPALPADLPAINAVIERAVMTWKLPERVKRLALPSYRYQVHDLDHLSLLVAETPAGGMTGVAALEPAAARDLPAGQTGLLLHGLYVDPDRQRQGIGTRLLDAALALARDQGHEGLLVKAQPDATGFFSACGMTRLAVKNPDRDYPHRYWKTVEADAAQPSDASPEDRDRFTPSGPPPTI